MQYVKSFLMDFIPFQDFPALPSAGTANVLARSGPMAPPTLRGPLIF